MLRRPLIIKLLAAYLLCEPLLRIVFLSIEKEFTLLTVFQRAIELAPLDFFNFWFLFPLSGLLLLSVKTVSYVFYIGLQCYSLYFHLSYEQFTWPYLSSVPSIPALLLLGMNLLITVYILLPRSREPFFNKDLRWWEQGGRFIIDSPCFITLDNKQIHGELKNLSHSGALILLKSGELAESCKLQIDFEVMNTPLALKGEVVRITQSNDRNQYGIRFEFTNFWQQLQLRFLLLSIEKRGQYEVDRQ